MLVENFVYTNYYYNPLFDNQCDFDNVASVLNSPLKVELFGVIIVFESVC